MTNRTVLDQVLADLKEEGDRLEGWVVGLTVDQWRTPTPAAEWDIATSIAHLAWTDEVAVLAARASQDKASWDAVVLEAMGDPTGYVDAQALAGAAADPGAILERWQASRAALADALRAVPEGEKMPWFGPPMSATSMATARFMESWAHGLDVADALGLEPKPTDRIRHVAHIGVRTRDFAFKLHDLPVPAEPFRVELTAPSGEIWTWGEEDAGQRVVGSAYGFCLLATQRRHRDDVDLTATGAEADRWLDVVQAFAGPPGGGRARQE